MSAEVFGACSPGLEGVREEFARNFAERGDIGAALCATVDGETVVDLWGGAADAAGARPWQRDTLVNVYSTTKGLTALCAHVLADRGQLDLDAPVAAYWPEFAAQGKADLPVRWLLSHRAGLIAPGEPLTTEEVYDWDRACAALAATRPWWEPGTAAGYHGMTFGFLVGEVVRRMQRKVARRLPGHRDRRTARRRCVHRHPGVRARAVRRHGRAPRPLAARRHGPRG